MLVIVVLFDSHNLLNGTFRAKIEFAEANPCTIGMYVPSTCQTLLSDLGGFGARRRSGNRHAKPMAALLFRMRRSLEWSCGVGN